MSEGLLDRHQIHSAQIELGCAKVSQDMRSHPVGPVRQMHRRRRGQRGPQCLVAHPGCCPVSVAAFGRKQRGTGPGVVLIEAAPHILHKPPQGGPCVVDQRHHPFTETASTGALAFSDMKLPEPAQVPLDIGQIEVARLVHAQPDLGHQSGRRVVAGGRSELATRRQLLAPAGEQRLHLHRRRRDP
jgi:hypothetical protein